MCRTDPLDDSPLSTSSPGHPLDPVVERVVRFLRVIGIPNTVIDYCKTESTELSMRQ
jgi:hypothetical protein